MKYLFVDTDGTLELREQAAELKLKEMQDWVGGLIELTSNSIPRKGVEELLKVFGIPDFFSEDDGEWVRIQMIIGEEARLQRLTRNNVASSLRGFEILGNVIIIKGEL